MGGRGAGDDLTDPVAAASSPTPGPLPTLRPGCRRRHARPGPRAELPARLAGRAGPRPRTRTRGEPTAPRGRAQLGRVAPKKRPTQYGAERLETVTPDRSSPAWTNLSLPM